MQTAIRCFGEITRQTMNMEKLWAVAEYAEAEDAEQLTRLAKNLNCFTFIKGASNYKEVGEFVTRNNEDFDVNPNVAKFFDYEAFGEHIGEIYYGEFVDSGFIYNDSDTSLLDILYQDETYITDCISKKVRVNNGERPKYYVENSHPAIIDSATFGRVQEELARRSGKRKISRKAKTEQGKYSSKYALTELLVCGECKTPYRRCTWTAGGKKKIVWRCINRLDSGKKYCHNSPTIEESILQKAVMTAIMETANQNTEVLRTLKLHIGMGLEGEKSDDNSLDLQVRIAEIDAEFRKMLDRVSTETVEAFDEETATRLMNEKSRLQQQLDNIADAEQRRENANSRLDDIYTILDGIKNRPMEYDDQIVRQLLECIVVDSKEQVTVIFKGGLKSVQPLTE